MAPGSIEAFILKFFINLVIWVSLFIFFFSILPRHKRWRKWLGYDPFPIWLAALTGVFAFLLHTLINEFLLN